MTQAAVSRPIASAVGAMAAPVRDAFRQGEAYGLRATASASEGQAGPPSAQPPPQPPAWAQRLASRQRLRDATFVATQTVREGDRPMGPASPDLKDDSSKG